MLYKTQTVLEVVIARKSSILSPGIFLRGKQTPHLFFIPVFL